MDNLFPAIIVIIGIIASIVSSAKKEKEKRAAEERRKAAVAARVEAAQKKQATVIAKPAAVPLVSFADAPGQAIAPTVHPHIQPDCETHDQPGSLGVTSMEGKDPCHEDELSMEHSFAEAPQQEGGLTFNWTGDSMVKAVVMQEVLTRPVDRVPIGQRHARQHN